MVMLPSPGMIPPMSLQTILKLLMSPKVNEIAQGGAVGGITRSVDLGTIVPNLRQPRVAEAIETPPVQSQFNPMIDPMASVYPLEQPTPQKSGGGIDLNMLYPPNVRRDEYGNPGGETKFGNLLRHLGLPIASTIAGLASPNMLPGAAGFNQGYVGGMQQATENERKRLLANQMSPIMAYDENGQVEIKGYAPKNAKMIKKGSDKPSKWDISKEARTRVNAMVDKNPEIQMALWNKQVDMNQLILDEEKKIQSEYGMNTPETTQETTERVTQQLPKGVSEEDIQHTMKLHNLTREEVLKRIQ